MRAPHTEIATTEATKRIVTKRRGTHISFATAGDGTANQHKRYAVDETRVCVGETWW